MKYEELKIDEYYFVEYAGSFQKVKILRKEMIGIFFSTPYITVLRSDGYVGDFEIDKFYPLSAGDFK